MNYMPPDWALDTAMEVKTYEKLKDIYLTKICQNDGY